ncbi:MAG TPA: hypothetical protein VHU14_06230 [Solirubrobacterales bacterium]|nr:hypothetical protein [Solirubrobacterales bacterium]
METVQPLGQLADPWGAGGLGHGALLEGAEVAVKRLAGAAQIAVDPLQLSHPLRLLGVDLGEGFGDRLANQRLLFEHGEELLENRLLQLVSGKPIGFAHFLSVALAGEAHVVAVTPAVAVRRRAEVLLAAAGALDQPGEQVRGLVGSAQRLVLGAAPQNLLGAVEEHLLDQRLVRCRVLLAPEGDLAQIGAVAQDREHGGHVEGLALAGARAALGQPLGECRGALLALGIAVEYLRDHRSLSRLGNKEATVAIESVAEGDVAANPLAAFGLTLHPGDGALDDGGALELGEDTEELHHHPPGRAGGVEGLRCRAEEHLRCIEPLEDLGQPAHRAREAVDAVDQKQVEAPGLGLAQGPFKARALQSRPRCLVGEAANDPPVLLALRIGIEPDCLRLQRVGLGRLVGRDSGVGGDLHRGLLGLACLAGRR